MTPLTLRLTPAELEEIRYRLSIEEPRVIRRANILICLHLGYVSSQIAQILNVDPKTVTNVRNAYLEGRGLESTLYDEERAGQWRAENTGATTRRQMPEMWSTHRRRLSMGDPTHHPIQRGWYSLTHQLEDVALLL